MNKSELKQLIREELLKEYSFPQAGGGYVTTTGSDINNFLHQIALARGNSLTNNKMKLERSDWENIIKILGDYLDSRFNFNS